MDTIQLIGYALFTLIPVAAVIIKQGRTIFSKVREAIDDDGKIDAEEFDEILAESGKLFRMIFKTYLALDKVL